MPAEPTVQSLDPRLAELGLAAERIRENLVALEIDPDRELLERAALVGESAARWANASARMAELWHGLGLLDTVLERARTLRGVRRPGRSQLGELRELLDGRSIELSSATVPLAERTLLGGAEITRRCSPTELLARMSDGFEIARAAVVEIGVAWEALTPRVEAVRRLSAEVERRAADQGETARRDLVEVGRQLATLDDALAKDPLAIASDQVDELGRALEAIRVDLEATAELARDHVARLGLARRAITELGTLARAVQTADAELIVKVVGTVAVQPTLALGPGPLEAALAEVAALVDAGAWPEARTALDSWTVKARASLAEARRALCALREPIEARNQFRGLLDAYQAKAGRLGLIEDPELAEVFAQACHELHTAPTDLALVGELVRRCQVALSLPVPARAMARRER
jgi:hypothetical protein